MEKAYIWEANTQFSSCIINLLSSVWLEHKLLLIQIMELTSQKMLIQNAQLTTNQRYEKYLDEWTENFTHSEFIF